MRPRGIPVRAELDSHPALIAQGRLEMWWVLQRLEVILVRAIPDIHLRRNGAEALFAILPMTLVAVMPVKRAERVAVVISRATVPRVREQDVFVMVIANPVSATTGLHQILRLAAKAAAGLRWIRFYCWTHLVIGSFVSRFKAGWRERKFRLRSSRCRSRFSWTLGKLFFMACHNDDHRPVGTFQY